MSTMTKVFVVLTAVLSIVASALFVSAAAQWDNWRELATSYQSERDAAILTSMHAKAAAQAALAQKDLVISNQQREIESAQKELQRLANEKAETDAKFAAALNEAAAAKASVTSLQESLRVTVGELSALRTQNNALADQTRDLQTRNTSLNARNLQLTTDTSIMTEQIRNMQEKLLACEQRYAAAPGTTATPVAEAGPSAPGAVGVVAGVRGPINGRIISVEGNYASISVGETSGVQKGMTFMVHRDGKYVGDLIVESVRPKESGGKLVTLVGVPQSGDRVVFGVSN